MPNRLLILSSHADDYLKVLRAASLPDLEMTACESIAQAAQLLQQDFNIIFGEPNLVRSLLPDLKALAWVQATWAGVEPLLAPGLRRDYRLTNVRGVFGPLMSEYVFGYMLAFERRIIQRFVAQKKSIWDNTPPGTLHGKTIGLLGVGSIGGHIAMTAKHFGMSVRGYTLATEDCASIDQYFHEPHLADFARGLNYLVAVLPNTNHTLQMVSREVFDALDSSTVFINVGRGASVDEDALAEALQNNRISGAVLDVFQQEPLPASHKFWNIPNLYITSHTAALSRPADIGPIFVRNYNHFINHESLENIVDFERGY